MLEYNKDMKIILYSSDEIEIIEEEQEKTKKWLFYFKNIRQLADLINTSPKLANELKGMIGDK